MTTEEPRKFILNTSNHNHTFISKEETSSGPNLLGKWVQCKIKKSTCECGYEEIEVV